MSAGTRYKFVVNSAEQAVKVLRERLGEDAKVISVRQIEGVGLARFLRAPKLEVIAEKLEPTDEALDAVVPPLASASEAAKAYEKSFEPPHAQDYEEAHSHDDLSRILHKGGFSDKTIARLKAHKDWVEITRLPMRKALLEVGSWLRDEYHRNPRKPVGDGIAFIGTPGVGKTTALCKQLVMDVLFKQTVPAVFKFDMEKPNPGDGLAAFCDVLGVPMFRSTAELEGRPSGETLYIDLPGLSPENSEEIVEAFELLDLLDVCTRVLVVNAAYDISSIKRAYRMGALLGGTHVIFSHLDELSQWGKLWEFILTPDLTPLFLSNGQNIGADFNESVFDGILERSFPRVGKEPALQPSAL